MVNRANFRNQSGSEPPPDKKQLAQFDLLWNEAVDKFNRGEFQSLARDGFCWTLVFKLPSDSSCSAALAELSSRMQQASKDQVYYERDQFHMTIFGLGPAETWRAGEPVKTILDRVAGEHSSIELQIIGMNVLSDSVVAQVIDATGELGRLAADLVHHCSQLQETSPAVPGFHEHLWWITLARLKEPLSNAAFSFISNHRTTEFGSLNMNRIALVETNRNFEPAHTRSIHEVGLG